MITTITLNPAIDKTIEIDEFSVDSVNRIGSTRLDAGGKGINVSKVILSLGGESRAVGVLAGRAGNFIKEYLDAVKIENDFIFVQGETRTNIKVVDKMKHTNTDINELGPEITQEDLQKVSDRIFQSLNKESVVVLSGSVPATVEKDIYRQWVAAVKKAGGKTILDADGELLKLGLEGSPYLVKPNIHELERLFDKKISTIEETIVLGKSILSKYGVQIVVISLGEKGALFLNEKCTILAKGIKVDVKSTVGAGDSMVAALAYCIDKGYCFEKAVTLAVASGTANVMTSGTEPSTLKMIMDLEKQVTFEYIENFKETKVV